MKRFLRTIPGKTITFILCILCFCILAVSIYGAGMIAKQEMYTKSEQELEQEIIDSQIHHKARELFNDEVRFKVKEITGKSEEVRFIYDTVVPDQGNMIFRFTDADGKEILASEHAGEIDDWEYTYNCIWIRDENGFSFFDFSDETPGANGSKVVLSVSLKQGLPENDSFRFLIRISHLMFSLRYAIYVIGGLAFVLMIICFIILICVSARKPDMEELYPGPLHAVPFDLMLVVTIAAGVFLAYAWGGIFHSYFLGIFIGEWFVIPLGMLYMIMLTGLCMSLAARMKQKKLLRNTLIFYLLKGLWILVKAFGKGIGKLPMIWKTVVAVVGVTLIEWMLQIGAGTSMSRYFFLSLIGKIIIVPIIFYIAWCMRRLQKSGEALAKGDLDYRTDTKGLFWDFKKHGENLNQISGAMATAVNEKLKSERMKTELITNVSHDIKTPLTSIINYAGLIGQESCEDEKIKEYADVLVRQSERLKRLLEDLVEASKASTGNLEVELVPCSANMFLSQTAGEYEEKLSAAQLKLVVNQPKEELKIMADGRRMWRIFDNLMNNICKYALPGTRVYLSLESSGAFAVFTFRNTSREPLNITEEELMERFKRGDSSRHTDGNGLGLSIAKSLTQLQYGELKIIIDADLFKAQLYFPMIH